MPMPFEWTQEEEDAMWLTLNGQTPGLMLTPLIMGIIIQSWLFGAAVVSVMNWWSSESAKHERRWVRMVLISHALSCVLTSTELFSTFVGTLVWLISVCLVMYTLGFNYGKYTTLIDYRWVAWFPLLDFFMAAGVQLFYAERAWKVTGRSNIFIGLALMPFLLSFVGSVGICVKGMASRTYLDDTYVLFGFLWVVGMFLTDIVITGTALWGLYQSRSEWEQTDYIVRRLIRVACESQLPPTILALALLIDIIIQRDTWYAVFFELIQGYVYIIGMVYVLNQRQSLNRTLEQATVQRSSQFRLGSRNRFPAGPATIHVQTETYVESHQINPEFAEHKIQPKLRQISETEFEGTSSSGHEGDYELAESSAGYGTINQSLSNLHLAVQENALRKQRTVDMDCLRGGFEK